MFPGEASIQCGTLPGEKSVVVSDYFAAGVEAGTEAAVSDFFSAFFKDFLAALF